MSEINLDLTVSETQATFVVETNDLVFTPTATTLALYSGASPVANGFNYSVQYNVDGIIQGSGEFLYTVPSQRLSVPNLSVSGSANFSSISNVHIPSGTNGYVIVTDGSGNLSWSANVPHSNTANLANLATYATTANSLNSTVANTHISGGSSNYILTTDGNSNLSWSASVSLANVANSANGLNSTISNTHISGGSLGALLQTDGANNLSWTYSVPFANIANGVYATTANTHILGGTNGYILQTNGLGNVSWVSPGSGSGNGVVGGTNTQVQFNDAGLFGGNVSFTFDKTTGNLTAPLFIGNTSGAVTNIPYGTENVSLVSASSGTINVDLYSNSINFQTSDAVGNVELNVRGNSTVAANTVLANGQSVTTTYVMKNGSNVYILDTLSVDGTSQTINWAGNLIPVSSANSYMSYTFTIIKTSTSPTFVVLGSGTRFG